MYSSVRSKASKAGGEGPRLESFAKEFVGVFDFTIPILDRPLVGETPADNGVFNAASFSEILARCHVTQHLPRTEAKHRMPTFQLECHDVDWNRGMWEAGLGIAMEHGRKKWERAITDVLDIEIR